MNKFNPTPHVGVYESTNPCGEQVLLPYESCNLGSINLSKFIISQHGNPHIDWEGLKKTVHLAVHFLDNVIDVNRYPIEAIKTMTLGNRKIGLGVMGWADMLINLGFAYDSQVALNLADKLMKFIHEEAMTASSRLAIERGVFPNYDGSIYDGSMSIRNATTTTIAPTGTISIIAGCSSGIEPLFAISYDRNVMDGQKLIEVNPYFEKAAIERGFWSSELMEAIAEQGSIHSFNEIPEDIKRIFVTAHDITPESHIKMQAAFQRHVDNAVSKTVNFPHEAKKEDVKQVYMTAYELGCKGVTVYRDGSREHQVLSTGKTGSEVKPTLDLAALMTTVPKKRPEVVTGATYRMNTGCGNLYVTINKDDTDTIFEVFTQMGKAGGCAASQAEAIGRLVSIALRSDVDPQEIVTQLKGIRCHSPAWIEGGKVLSCADALAQAIEKAMTNKQDRVFEHFDTENYTIITEKHTIIFEGACPECGGVVEHEGGCSVCHDCGFTKC
jgi:ribonucleoside-diphosphate reductase alpha chain